MPPSGSGSINVMVGHPISLCTLNETWDVFLREDHARAIYIHPRAKGEGGKMIIVSLAIP